MGLDHLLEGNKWPMGETKSKDICYAASWVLLQDRPYLSEMWIHHFIHLYLIVRTQKKESAAERYSNVKREREREERGKDANERAY